MKIIIQCAASKERTAGYFQSDDGKPIKFVAHPEHAPLGETYPLARPDDFAKTNGDTWRNLVADYNQSRTGNPFGLFPAYRLYSNPAYRAVVEKFGEKSVYILSAGWGLIRSDFLTPQYNITFSASAERFKRRLQRDPYADFCHLSDDGAGQILFFGGKDYLPLFCRLTAALDARRIVFFNSKTAPKTPGCLLVRYETTMRTNWHYACVNDFLRDKITLP